MADESKWTPKEVRALVKDVGQWILLVLAAYFAYRIDSKAAKVVEDAEEMRKDVGAVKADVRRTHVLMGLPEPKE